MITLFAELKSLLKQDPRLTADGELLKNQILELALKLDRDLMRLLLSNERIKTHFFADVDSVLIFDREKFTQFVSNKEFLPDSYTTFKNEIGLTTLDGHYLSKSKEVVLSWPYKDCVLEGGQDREDAKRDEIFWNEILGPDEIDRLLAPKVLTNFKRYDSKGDHKIREFNENDNFIIKGNNLLALHSLKKRFGGKVKLIYIDPPYNIGNDSFGYNDSFNHSSWLTFMKNRLDIARQLLTNDGAILVQIDLHELGYLQSIMDEVFFEQNKVQIIAIKTASPAGFKTVNPGPIDVAEYILFYIKDRKAFKFKRNYVAIDYDENYGLYIQNKDDKPEKWKLVPLRDIVYEQNGIKVGKTAQESNSNAKKVWGEHWKIIRYQVMAKYALENAERVVSIRDPHKPSERLKEAMNKSKENPNRVLVFKKSVEDEGLNEDGKGESYLYNGGALSIYSNKVVLIDGIKTPSMLLTDFWADLSWDGIAKEGGVKLKNGKKPEKLIKRIIEMSANPGDIVLDYHLGSGTTAAVAHKMGCKYIGIEQLDYGQNDSVVRLQNVINGDTTGISKSLNWQGGGSFIYCELKEWNDIFVRQIKKAKDAKELQNIWNDMQAKAFLSYRLDVKRFNANAAEFSKLSVEEQKRFLLEALDKNHLYVNLSEMDDETYGVNEEDKHLNRLFYGI